MSHKRLSHLLLLAGGIAGVGALGVLIDYARMLAFRALERPEMALRYWGLLVFLCLVAAVYGAALYQYVLPTTTGYLIFMELVIVASIWYAAMLLPYQCGYSLMAERQNMSCWRAVRTAAKSCRGHRFEFFYG